MRKRHFARHKILSTSADDSPSAEKCGYSIRNALRRVFPTDRGGWTVLLLVTVIQGIVLYNACRHASNIGYDDKSHITCVKVLAGGHLPTSQETYEFFSPPLPYLPAVLVYALGPSTERGLAIALRLAQITNFAYSGILLWIVLKICRLARPGRRDLEILSLLILATLTVYYRTFAFVRGEPLLAMLILAAVHQTLRLTQLRRAIRWNAIWLGFIAGGAILSRQWAFFFFPALFFFLLLRVTRGRESMRRATWIFATVCIAACLVGGWFYIHLKNNEGRITAFNRPMYRPFSLRHHPRNFYVSFPLRAMLTNPVRPSFEGQIIPIFYSDLWGDYWSYFLVYARNKKSRNWINGYNLSLALKEGDKALAEIKTNRNRIARYLGRINAVSSVVSLMLVLGFFWGAWHLARSILLSALDTQTESLAWLFIISASCISGYAFFLISTPTVHGDTIKPSYLLHVFPLLAILTADLVISLGSRFPQLKIVLIGSILLTFLHNAPAFFTRFAG